MLQQFNFSKPSLNQAEYKRGAMHTVVSVLVLIMLYGVSGNSLFMEVANLYFLISFGFLVGKRAIHLGETGWWGFIMIIPIVGICYAVYILFRQDYEDQLCELDYGVPVKPGSARLNLEDDIEYPYDTEARMVHIEDVDDWDMGKGEPKPFAEMVDASEVKARQDMTPTSTRRSSTPADIAADNKGKLYKVVEKAG